jgi:hypothetical protein
MAGGMVFRKDCKECGRSFFTPDRKTSVCPRCARVIQEAKQAAKPTKEKNRIAAEAATPPKASGGVRSPLASAEGPKPKPSSEGGSLGDRKEPKGKKVRATETGGRPRVEIVLTREQEQEILGRYQAYVEKMERPSRGRRRTIADEMGLPQRAVVLFLRKWSAGKDLSREERFRVEKTYFDLLDKSDSLSELKEQISQSTGFSHWQVCRYLDMLHDGTDPLSRVPDVSPEQRTAILTEYHAYLSAPAPPGPGLHALIAERVGVVPKQVHKVLLDCRLGRLREKQS